MTLLRLFVRFALAAGLLGLHAVAGADALARFRTSEGDIQLMTEGCGAKRGGLQQAVKRQGATELHGCWAVNARGDPVVVWSDGSMQELDQARVQLTPRYAALLDDLDAPPPRAAGQAAAPSTARPGWCQEARFPHERLVCRDAELAAADLALAPLWSAYRTGLGLNAVQQARVKGDYFRRLKACGASRGCIAREQAAQARFYREALKPVDGRPGRP